jgi:hypothetical protein
MIGILTVATPEPTPPHEAAGLNRASRSSNDGLNANDRAPEKRQIDRCDIQEMAKLEALQSATAVGIAAIESGHFHEFPDEASLEAHLRRLADNILGNDDSRR